MQPAPPTPLHLLRHHQSPLSALSFSPGNTHLYSGDQAGVVSITDLRLRRTVRTWQAHDGGVLSLEEWDGRLLTHGRDNKLHIYLLPSSSAPRLVGREANTAPLELEQSLPTNSLNFCRFSLLPLPFTSSASAPPDPSTSIKGKSRATIFAPEGAAGAEALLALPNLGDSELVDVYHLPSLERVHAGLNWLPRGPRPADGGKQEGRTGLVMGIHLGLLPDRDASSPRSRTPLGCAVGYEDGRFEVWALPNPESDEDVTGRWTEKSDPRLGVGQKWTKVWEAQGHNEAVMALAVDRRFERAFTVSADHMLVRYDLLAATDMSQSDAKPASTGETAVPTQEGPDTWVRKYPLKQIGNASVAISADGTVVAVGGWDGRIRLFSAATFKPLGTLAYHRESVHCLVFANLVRSSLTAIELSKASSDPAAVPPFPHKVSSAEQTPMGGLGADPADSASPMAALQHEADSTIDLDVGATDSDDSELDEGEDVPRSRWLASGGKDRRVALWGLMDFARGVSS